MLTESITHLEDLDLQAFITTVGNISKLQATEKLDGAQLWFGLDKEGRLYTSRAGKSKSAENIYNEEDYPYFASSNGFRSAHAALKAKEEEIKSVLRPGDTIEVEVLYGRQPNAVTYGSGGKNYIAFLRGVEGTQDLLVDQLANRLANQSVRVSVKVVDTVDGENLKLEPAEVTYQFVGVQKIDGSKLRQVDVSKQLNALNTFLKKKAGLPGSDITNFELLTSSLGSFDKTIRPQAKDLKAKLAAQVMTDFKLPIKKELLSKFVHQVKSPLAADDLTPDEDIGIEGVVLRDPSNSDEQVKLVDKDTFTTINQFNHTVRASVNGMIRTTDLEAPLESRGGLLGELKIMIADLLGNREMARTQGAKKIFTTLKGKTPEETVKNVANELTGGDDYLGTRRKIMAMIDATLEKLATMLNDYKANKDNFQLKLKSGKTLGHSPEIIRRTLLTFAESKRDLVELREKTAKTKNLAQLTAVLYGKIAKAVHSTGEEAPMTEAKKWSVNLHPDFDEMPHEKFGEESKKIIAAFKKKGVVKLKRLFDEGEGSGFELEVTTDDSVDEDDMWDVVASTPLEFEGWGGMIALKEEKLLEKRIFTDKTQYQNKDAWTLLNIYLATVMMSTVIYKANDRLGIRILKDKTHCRLTKWTKEMSPLNFWGYVIWRCGTPQVEKLVGRKVAKDIFRHARKAPPNWWRYLHMDLSFGRDVPIDWADHRKTLLLLQHYPGMNVDRVNSLLDKAFKYEELTFDEKVKFLGKLYFYVNQFIPISPLLTRIRAIQDNLLLNANGENYQMVSEMKLLRSVVALKEEGEEGGAPVTTSSATVTSTTASAIAPLEKRLTTKIKRRQWQKPKFQDPSKVNEGAKTGKSVISHSVADLNIPYSGGTFDCNSNRLTSLEGAPSSISGDFVCHNNRLTSLEGAPSSVSGDFVCHNNRLTSLEGAPSSVSGFFYCHSNQLTTLQGAPASVGGGFYCNNNQLTSLEGAPSSVDGVFQCSANRLTSLEGAPASVGGGFYCNNNQLTSLEGAPSSIGDSFFCDNNQLTSFRGIHRIIKQINGIFSCSDNPIEKDLLYILLIKGIKSVNTPFDPIDDVINDYLQNAPSGSIKAVFDVQEILNNKGIIAP